MMNIRKTILTTTLLCAGSVTVLLADNSKAIEFYKTGRTEPAKQMLLQNFKAGGADKAEAAYFLGRIYTEASKLDSALYYYKAGREADPANPLNQIGEISILKTKNAAAATQQFEELLSNKLYRKNPKVFLAVASAYMDEPAKAEVYLDQARTMDKKLADIYVIEADMQAANKDYNGAAASYEQAITFDPNCKEAYVKYARIYAPINADLAIQMLQRMLQQDPSSAVAHREMAEIYYKEGKLMKAADEYAEYIHDEYVSPSDKARYATILFFKGDYAKSKEIVEQAIKITPNDQALNRLQFFNDYELGNYDAAMAELKDYFGKFDPKDFIDEDYSYYGSLLIKEGKFQEGIDKLQQALKLDPKQVALYQEIGSAYEKLNDFDNAIASFSSYIDNAPKDQVQVMDYFNLGKSAYYAGNEADTTAANAAKRAAYFAKADSLFAYVGEKVPDSYLGYFWRARANSALDPETDKGLAKPYYEKTIEVLDAKGDGDTRIYIECYSYLGYYHYVKEEMEKSKEYWSKILTIDPTNELAQRALSGIK